MIKYGGTRWWEAERMRSLEERRAAWRIRIAPFFRVTKCIWCDRLTVGYAGVAICDGHPTPRPLVMR